jgi:hypothetical protein
VVFSVATGLSVAAGLRGPPAYYDDETRRALAALRGRVDTERAERMWDEVDRTHAGAAAGSIWAR